MLPCALTGHNHQFDAWTLPNQGEVTCNLFSLWASENIMKVNRSTRYTDRKAQQDAYFRSGVFPASFETSTGILQIMQLQENAGGRLNYTGGWEFWSRFLARMQQLSGTPAVATTDAKIQTWIVETSRAANKNLVGFYRQWKFPVTPETEANVTSLPAFAFDATTCQEECGNCCLPGDMSPSIDGECRHPVTALAVTACTLCGPCCVFGQHSQEGAGADSPRQGLACCPAGMWVSEDVCTACAVCRCICACRSLPPDDAAGFHLQQQDGLGWQRHRQAANHRQLDSTCRSLRCQPVLPGHQHKWLVEIHDIGTGSVVNLLQ